MRVNQEIERDLERELIASDVVRQHCRDDVYAQNLYAAMCNNDFIKNDFWPLLTEETWSRSWRSAGGIVAHMRGEGDYIDWYCSGIKGEWSDEEYNNATKENQERYIFMKNNYVGEGCITEEIRQDLFNLGWMPFDGDFKMFE